MEKTTYPLFSKTTKLYNILMACCLAGFLFAAFADYANANYVLMALRLALTALIGFLFWISISGQSKYRPRIELYHDHLFVRLEIFNKPILIKWENIKELKISPMAITLVDQHAKTNYIYLPENMSDFDTLKKDLIEKAENKKIKVIA